MSYLLKISVVIFICLPVYTTIIAATANNDDKQIKAVLITGASSGIGRSATEALAAEGYFVYAGARKQRDIDSLNKIPNVQAVRLDVTIQEQVDAAVEVIRKGGRGLYGLVNNAGIGSTSGPLLDADETDIRWLFDVNVFGVLKVTKAFSPMIIKSKGRITTIGSIAGILTWFGGADYTMSKSAIEAFSDTLALEMEVFDVKTSVIQPGNYNSDISKSNLTRRGELTDKQKKSAYADYYAARLKATGDRSQHKDPDEVTTAIKHALFDANPKKRYMVVPNHKEAKLTIAATLTRVAQRNEGQEHAFSRKELIKMLDQAIEAEKVMQPADK